MSMNRPPRMSAGKGRRCSESVRGALEDEIKKCVDYYSK